MRYISYIEQTGFIGHLLDVRGFIYSHEISDIYAIQYVEFTRKIYQ